MKVRRTIFLNPTTDAAFEEYAHAYAKQFSSPSAVFEHLLQEVLGLTDEPNAINTFKAELSELADRVQRLETGQKRETSTS